LSTNAPDPTRGPMKKQDYCNTPKPLGLGSSIFLHKAAKIHKVYQIT